LHLHTPPVGTTRPEANAHQVCPFVEHAFVRTVLGEKVRVEHVVDASRL
jgi:hypothetical protein